jgi:RND family efflux transporter MFP subunit
MQLKFDRLRWPGLFLGLAVLPAILATWYVAGRDRSVAVASDGDGKHAEGEIVVEVIKPRAGGIDRICLQPGTVEPFESADLYSKVSGFLIELKVDIGDRVEFGQVLARIAAPELEKQVKQDTAEVKRAEAREDQAAAAVGTAEADVGAASAGLALAKAEKKAKVSFRTYREKQLHRTKELVSRDALERRLLEEEEDFYEASVSAEHAATEAVAAATQRETAGKARVKQAEADLRYAKADLEATKAKLEKSQTMLDYTIIKSPYTGTITKRNFHRGDFIRSADSGGDRIPLLAVERTDVMRIIVQVPERDAPFVDVGDPARVDVDALPGIALKPIVGDKLVVSRFAESEDAHTRMMRTEVHVKNPDRKLRRGMFGRVQLTLQLGDPSSVRIPSAALVGRAEGGKATVRVERDGKAFIVTVQSGMDNGSEIEVLSGLQPGDRVILRASESISDGVTVVAKEAKSVKSGH